MKKVMSVDGKGTVFQVKLKLQQIVWIKTLEREIKKNLMNLIKTNHHIKMASDHSVSRNNSFKSFLNVKFHVVFDTVTIARRAVILLQCMLQGWCDCIRVMWI